MKDWRLVTLETELETTDAKAVREGPRVVEPYRYRSFTIDYVTGALVIDPSDRSEPALNGLFLALFVWA
jgi:hypothetical protein